LAFDDHILGENQIQTLRKQESGNQKQIINDFHKFIFYK
jgi:hypothetical protein